MTMKCNFSQLGPRVLILPLRRPNFKRQDYESHRMKQVSHSIQSMLLSRGVERLPLLPLAIPLNGPLEDALRSLQL